MFYRESKIDLDVIKIDFKVDRINSDICQSCHFMWYLKARASRKPAEKYQPLSRPDGEIG